MRAMTKKGSLLIMFKIFSTLEIFLFLGVLKHVKFPPRFFFPVFIVVWQHQTCLFSSFVIFKYFYSPLLSSCMDCFKNS